MSYGHQPKFGSRAPAEFRALAPWPQEEASDEVGRLIPSPSPMWHNR